MPWKKLLGSGLKAFVRDNENHLFVCAFLGIKRDLKPVFVLRDNAQLTSRFCLLIGFHVRHLSLNFAICCE